MNYEVLQKLGLDVKRIKKNINKQSSNSKNLSKEILITQAKKEIDEYTLDAMKTRKKYLDMDEITKKELQDIDDLLFLINNFIRISTGEDLEKLQEEQKKYINMKNNISKVNVKRRKR